MASATTGPYWNDRDDPTRAVPLETDNKFPPLSFPCFHMTMNEPKIKMTTLTNPTDDELNKAFAVHVANISHPITGIRLSDDCTTFLIPPTYTESMDAVLPWLSKTTCEMGNIGPGWTAEAVFLDGGYGSALADTLPKACVLALLKAHGVEVVYSGLPAVSK